MRRSWSKSSSLTAIGISNGPLEVFAHERTFREDAGQQKREQHSEPAVDRKAGTQVERMCRSCLEIIENQFDKMFDGAGIEYPQV